MGTDPRSRALFAGKEGRNVKDMVNYGMIALGGRRAWWGRPAHRVLC